MEPGGPVEALQRCQEEGLIAHLGVGGGPIDLMIRFVETGIFEAAISHNRFTLLNRKLNHCGRYVAQGSRGDERGAVWKWYAGERTERLPALYVWLSLAGPAAERRADGRGMPSPRSAAGGGSAAIFAAGCAHRLHDCRHHAL